MVIKTYIDKSNTIISGTSLNTGLNPIGELNYGENISRMLIHFPIEKINNLIEDKTCPDKTKFRHVLHMTNAGSIDSSELHSKYESKISNGVKTRATSFDLIFFILPDYFDAGSGFEGKNNFFNQGYFQKYTPSNATDASKMLSEDGSNWYQSSNGKKWSDLTTEDIPTSDGIYSNDFLSKEYEKYAINEESVIIGAQHFDIGNEDIDIDITDYINSVIDKKITNNGIGIAFAPMLERTKKNDVVNYTGFFTNNSDTFFVPFIDSLYQEYICDDRQKFSLDSNNKLYIYSSIDGNLENLDELPTCEIEDKQYEVFQESKGVYYINVTLSSKKYTNATILYDVWSNLKYKGQVIDDVEQYFTIQPNFKKMIIGNTIQTEPRFLPNVYGIRNKETLINSDGEIRKIVIECKEPFTSNRPINLSNIKFRLYVKDGEREITVIDYDNVNLSNNENNYYLRIGDLIPNEYYIDIKVKRNNEVITYKNLCDFTIANDVTNKFI